MIQVNYGRQRRYDIIRNAGSIDPMNPWAVPVILIALACFVVAVKGTQANVIATVTGKPYTGSAGKDTLG